MAALLLGGRMRQKRQKKGLLRSSSVGAPQACTARPRASSHSSSWLVNSVLPAPSTPPMIRTKEKFEPARARWASSRAVRSLGSWRL